jgi:septal ring factor EnvC (AmiA/AmiB activator)
MRADCLSIRVLMMALVASLLISAVVNRPLHAAEAPADMPPDVSAEQQLQAVSEAISQIQRWLQTTRAQRSVEEQALLESSQQLNMLRQQMFANQRQLSVLESELTRLTAEQDVLLKDSEQQRSQIASTLVASYLSGSDSQLKLLLNQQDPAIARRMLVYFEAFNQQRIAHIIRWRDTLAELAVNRETLLTTADQLSDLNNSLQQQQITLESQQLARETLISELTTQMGARGSELDILIADQLELQALINEINSVVIDIPAPEELMPFAASRGNMPWPANGRLLAAYGDVFGAGQLRRHGIVIAAETGSPIRAIHPGRVIFSDWLRGSGNLLIVDHGNAYISLYSHNQQLLKQSGDWVNRGEALALSGEDGGTGEPGLYFEIRRNSETLNPADWLVTPD